MINGDPTFRAVLRAAGELPNLVGDHDWHGEPSIGSRVYFVLDPAACQIKVGYTARPVGRRVAELEKQRGRKLDLLGSLTGGSDLEQALHGRFRLHRREGRDWYSSEIIGEVAELLAAA